ncbi:thiamine pyrophosphate-binding protein [Bilifractor porci]|uniref:Thiamine pyrophosphate-binding protein n=1 Tax=Bilifractor porci TaxID=2606636 RepID=A0A7X2P8N0_9FIRM|nr:thiamine pyrophosphate-binding protein [Bilifractor porci]MST82272.1 thiamine pyrophosphate-binding protein [Bilifractor porci]
MKLSDYVTQFLVENGITTAFMVPGGLAMHLNDSFKSEKRLHCVLNHHEQACAMAAEGYARVNNRMAVVSTTGGPAATNALTGVLCAWQDSIPLLVISGNSRLATMACESGLTLRSRGIQECEIVRVAEPITKYAVMIKNPDTIRYHMEKAFCLARVGRPGPCWIDIPMDIQTKDISPESQEGYGFFTGRVYTADGWKDCAEKTESGFECPEELAKTVLEHLRTARRPVLFAGNGIRLGGAHRDFMLFAEKTGIPVVDGMSSVDAFPTDSELFAGRCGTTGTRPGNFAVQNSDVILSLGSRLNYNQTGFDGVWGRNAFRMINDIDPEEIRKDTVHADLALACDVKSLLDKLNGLLDTAEAPLLRERYAGWRSMCLEWRRNYPLVNKEKMLPGKANIYHLADVLTGKLPLESTMVVSAGQSRIIFSQAANIREGQRFLANATTASMGYGLPAGIGAALAAPERLTAVVTGEGSIQMNLQELQTIVHNRIPLKIVLINNGGYHTVKQTQHNYFHDNFIGIGPESGDISFPFMEKIAGAYGIPYISVRRNEDVDRFVDRILASEGVLLAEAFVDPAQTTDPKASTRKLPSGEMVSAPLEDMAPFLDREELKKIMEVGEKNE